MLAFVDDIFGDVAEVLDALCVFHVCSLCGKCYGVYGGGDGKWINKRCRSGRVMCPIVFSSSLLMAFSM